MLVAGSTLLYLPIAIFGYYLYGHLLNDNVLLNLPDGGLRIAALVLISAHALFGVFLNINPVAQLMEDIIGLDRGERTQNNQCRIGQ